MIYGYARISTKKQSIDRQVRNIKQIYPGAVIVQETYTGTTMDRPMWNKLMNQVKPRDIIVFDSVSRMARTAEDGYKTYETLYDKGIDLIFLKEPGINTLTYKKAVESSIPLTNTNVDYILEGINKYLLVLAREQIILAFEMSQRECEAIHQRTKEALAMAKINGKILGHKKHTPIITKQSISDKEIILKYSKDFNGSLPDVECRKLCKCCKQSYYKYKKELKKSLNL